MSTDPREQRPDPQSPRRVPPSSPTDPTGRLGSTGRQMPQNPVIPRFSDQPDDSGRSMVRGCNGYMVALVAMSVIVLALMILALFLPPFSLWNSIDNRLSGDEKATTDSGVQIVDGLAFVALNSEVSQVSNDGLTVAVPQGQFAGPFGVYTSVLARLVIWQAICRRPAGSAIRCSRQGTRSPARCTAWPRSGRRPFT